MNGQVPYTCYSHIRKYLPGTYEAYNVYFGFDNCFETYLHHINDKRHYWTANETFNIIMTINIIMSFAASAITGSFQF